MTLQPLLWITCTCKPSMSATKNINWVFLTQRYYNL